MIWPVMKGASRTRNSAVRAMSSGVPWRLSAVFSTISRFSEPSMSPSGQSTGPGAMPLTRISGPSSRASERVSIASPAFAAL